MKVKTRSVPYEALFRPRSVALVGASDDPAKTTSRPLRNLIQSGWAGQVYPVNPNRDTVDGRLAYPDLDDVPEVPDHVFVLTGADLAVKAVEDCARLGVPVVTVMADGFVGNDAETVRRLSRLKAAAGSTRILGPSSLGVVNVSHRLVLTANAAFSEPDLPSGGIFVASQSGSVIGAIASRGKDAGIGFAAMVSTGSEVDLSLGSICRASVEDPDVTSYILFLENLNHIEDLSDFAHAAAAQGKPVLAYKLGRSDAAAELAVSHTGALAGDDVVADAVLRDLGIIRVHQFDALLEAHPLARRSQDQHAPSRPPQVAVVSTTGGGGAMVVDCLAVAGAVPQPPSEETRRRLAAAGIEAGHGSLVDLTLAGTRYDVMRSALDILMAAPEFDAVVAAAGSSARFHPDLAVKPIVDSAVGPKPLAAFLVPSAPDALATLQQAGVSAFRSPDACADAVVSVLSRKTPRLHIRPPAVKVDLVDPAATVALDERRSYQVLGRLGVTYAPFELVQTVQVPRVLPVPGPAAVKVLAHDLAHKSDLGGVVLGVRDGAGLRTAVQSIVSSVGAANPAVTTDQVLVQQMVKGLGEALIGYRVDEHVGPIVMLAAGGVLAELLEDRSVRMAPVDEATAASMIDEVLSFRALMGYRGLPEGDMIALRDAVVAISRAGEVPGQIVEVEVNPMIICARGEGAHAVDAVVRVPAKEY